MVGYIQTINSQNWRDTVNEILEDKPKDAINILMQHKNEWNEIDENSLGCCYELLNDYANAIKWYEISGKHKNGNALFNLGRIYDYHHGNHPNVVPDSEKSKSYYKKAIFCDYEMGVSYAVLNFYVMCKDENKLDECKPILEDAVRRKFELIEAPYILAEFFYKDKKESLYYYRISAEHGNRDAQYQLATILQEGKFIEKDMKEAVRWYRKAADQGDWNAEQKLGICYEELYLKTLDERYLQSCLKYYYNIYTDDNESGMPRIINLGKIGENIKVDEKGNWMVEEPEDPLKDMYLRGMLNAEKYSTYEDWLKIEVKPLAVASDVDVNIPINNTKSKSYALVVANENYNYEHYVPYAENDGEIFRKYLENTFGIPSNHIHLVNDASLNTLKREIEWLVENGQDAENLYFYYSGHGIPANDLSTSYLLPCDGYAKDPETGLSLQWLYSKLGSMDIPCFVFLDACFSGSGRDKKMLVESRGVAIKAKDVIPQNKTVVISACQGVEMAYPYEEQKHGLFTYCLLKKIQDSKGDITLGELSDYVKVNVPQYSRKENGKSQTPAVIPSQAVVNSWQSMKLK